MFNRTFPEKNDGFSGENVDLSGETGASPENTTLFPGNSCVFPGNASDSGEALELSGEFALIGAKVNIFRGTFLTLALSTLCAARRRLARSCGKIARASPVSAAPALRAAPVRAPLGALLLGARHTHAHSARPRRLVLRRLLRAAALTTRCRSTTIRHSPLLDHRSCN